MQNSRRGGANRVATTIEQDGDSTRVTLIDDGAGIADPAVLLTFGESNWKPGIAEAEDPAGFGLLALSRRGCTLRWRVPGQDPSPGYRLVLEPAHFLGRDAAHVVPDDSAPWPHGTAITFEARPALGQPLPPLRGLGTGSGKQHRGRRAGVRQARTR